MENLEQGQNVVVKGVNGDISLGDPIRFYQSKISTGDYNNNIISPSMIMTDTFAANTNLPLVPHPSSVIGDDSNGYYKKQNIANSAYRLKCINVIKEVLLNVYGLLNVYKANILESCMDTKKLYTKKQNTDDDDDYWSSSFNNTENLFKNVMHELFTCNPNVSSVVDSFNVYSCTKLGPQESINCALIYANQVYSLMLSYISPNDQDSLEFVMAYCNQLIPALMSAFLQLNYEYHTVYEHNIYNLGKREDPQDADPVL